MSTDWPSGFTPPPGWDSSSDGSSSSGSGSGAGCELSPAGSALSAILSAFIGSIITGITSGWLVAFMTGWIAWLAVFRVLVGGSYMFFRTATNTWPPPDESVDAQGNTASYLMVEDQNSQQYPLSHVPPPYHSQQGSYGYQPAAAPELSQAEELTAKARSSVRHNLAANFWPPAAMLRAPDIPQLPRGVTYNPRAWFAHVYRPLNRKVKWYTWIGWAYGAIYAPIAQGLWIAANMSRDDNGAAKIVKGLTVAVTALPLCIDCRLRYAQSLKWPWATLAFNLTNSVSCMLQGVFCAVLLVTGLTQVADGSPAPVPIVGVVYAFFAFIWMAASFTMLPVRDGGRRQAGDSHWAGYILDAGVGAFAGTFLAAPAMALYMSARFDDGGEGNGFDDIMSYLECETDALLRFAAIAP